MSRMLEALKVLENRKPAEAQPMAPIPPVVREPVSKPSPARPEPIALRPPELPAAKVRVQSPPAAAQLEPCVLPIAAQVPDAMLQLASRVSEQLAANYCNVVLFVASGRRAAEAFSMTHLAQAFALQSVGDVLLVDGDLRHGELTKAVARPGAGMIEVMQGAIAWPEIIHPTNVARIDFVSRGRGQAPTFDRTEFGWGALRPLYRAVLIGLSPTEESETAWLAARCDGVYLALSLRGTSRQAARRATGALRESGANLLGCVVVED